MFVFFLPCFMVYFSHLWMFTSDLADIAHETSGATSTVVNVVLD